MKKLVLLNRVTQLKNILRKNNIENFKKFKKITIFSYVFLIFSIFFIIYKFELNNYFSINFLNSKKELIQIFLEKYFFLIAIIYGVLIILWTVFLGFGTPLLIITGFLYNPIFGTFFLLIFQTIGAALLFKISNFYFREGITKFIKKKYLHLNRRIRKIKKNELILLIFIRLIPGIPCQIADLFPVLLNVKLKNYIIGKFVGSFIPYIITINMFYNFFYIYKNNQNLKIINFQDDNFLISIFIFIILILFGYLFKRNYYK